MFKTNVYDKVRGALMMKQENEQTKTRERILTVACEVFAEQGFHKTTIRDICQQAKVNVAAVNYYFGSKENLYEAVCKYLFGLSVKNADPRFKLNEASTEEENLRTIIRDLLVNLLSQDRSNWRHMIMSREMVDPTSALTIVIKDMIKPRFQQLYAVVEGLLGENAQDELIRRCCLSITAQCLYYRFAQPVVLKLNPQQKFDKTGIEKLADHIARFSLNAIKQFAVENKERK
jgi:AcrR family transcriptional regulator